MSSATLVSSWAAKLRATAAWERSCTTRRKPSATAIKLTTIRRWAWAVRSTERLSILHQEGCLVGRHAQPGAALPAQAKPVDAVAALQLSELIGIAQPVGQVGRIAEHADGVRATQPAGIVDQDIDARVVERAVRPHPLPVDGNRLRSTGPEEVDDVLEILVVNGPAQGLVGGVVRIGAIVQGDREAGAVQGGESGGQPLIIELRLHLLNGARPAGALVLPGLDLCLERLDLGFQRPVLILELVDALPQRFVAGEAVGGGQWLTSKLG